MARIRVIRPEFWDDEKIAKLSRDARLLFIGFWTNSDDYGVIKGNPHWLKSRIFPYDNIEAEEMERWIKELENVKVIIKFEAGGEPYYYIKNFGKHQIIERHSKIRNPAPPEHIIRGDESPMNHRLIVDESSMNRRLITDESPINHRCIADESPINRRLITDESSINHRCVADESSINRRSITDIIEIEKEIEIEVEREIENNIYIKPAPDKNPLSKINQKNTKNTKNTPKTQKTPQKQKSLNPPPEFLKQAFTFWQKVSRRDNKVVLPRPGDAQFARLEPDIAKGYRFIMRENNKGEPDWESTHKDIISAIQALSDILANKEKYWFHYAPDIGAFFRQKNWLPKFLPDANPYRQFLKKEFEYREPAQYQEPKLTENQDKESLKLVEEENEAMQMKLQSLEVIKNLKVTADREKILQKARHRLDAEAYDGLCQAIKKTLTSEAQPDKLYLEVNDIFMAYYVLHFKGDFLLKLNYPKLREINVVISDGEAWRLYKE